MSVCVCMYVHTYMYVRMCVHECECVCTCIDLCIYVHTFMYVCTYVHVRIYLHSCMHSFAFTLLHSLRGYNQHEHICMYMYIHYTIMLIIRKPLLVPKKLDVTLNTAKH